MCQRCRCPLSCPRSTSVGQWQSWDLLQSPGALSKYLSPGDSGQYLETCCLSQLGRSFWHLVENGVHHFLWQRTPATTQNSLAQIPVWKLGTWRRQVFAEL